MPSGLDFARLTAANTDAAVAPETSTARAETLVNRTESLLPSMAESFEANHFTEEQQAAPVAGAVE